MPQSDYTDLQIRIMPRADERGGYPVEATLSDGSCFSGLLELDSTALLALQLDPDRYGRALGQALFAGEIGRAYDYASGVAQTYSAGQLRVRLRVDAPDLHVVPWERLCPPHDDLGACPLSADSKTPFSRYTSLQIAHPRPLSGAVRVLLACANPRDPDGRYGLAAFDVGEELRAICDALASLTQIGVTIMPGRSGLPPDLDAQLRQAGYQIKAGNTSLDAIIRELPGHQVLHLVGHGRVKTLYLEDQDDGSVAPVADSDLVARLRLGALPQLIFLTACQSAAAPSNSPADAPFSGLGPQLVRAGVPAVVAMQGDLPIALAARLHNAFYQQLFRHGAVDLALNAARGQLYDEREGGWDLPVLYTRLETGQLFTPDPVYLALERLCADESFRMFGSPRYLKLPITVRHHVPSASQRTDDELRAVAADKLADALNAVFSEGPGARGRIAAILGPHGSNKTTQLQFLVWQGATQALNAQPASGERRIPLYMSLERFAETMRAGALQELVIETLRGYWPEAPKDILEDKPGLPTMRLVFDDMETLSPRQRDQAWRDLAKLASDYPRHEYLVAGRPDFLLRGWINQAPDLFPPASLHWNIPPPLISDQIDLHVLIVQPLSHDEIRRFLRDVPSKDFGVGRSFGQELLQHMERARLTNLMRIPSFLYRTFQQAQTGEPPRSRIALLQQVVDMAIARVSTQNGMRAHTEETLYRLAWQMQQARQPSWPLSQAFAEMDQIRGRRGYSLEEFLGELLKSGALSQVDDDALCFAYAPLQAYCCAQAIARMPNRMQVIDDITATLGRQSRLQAWSETLICLSGLLTNDEPALEQLLRDLVYGVNLLEGEQSFVAVSCLAEVNDQRFVPDLRRRVIDSLIWSLNNSNEPHTNRRERAARALGQLADPSTIPVLCRVANQRQRMNWRGVPEYELSSVRLAAIQSLSPMFSRHSRQIGEVDSNLADVLRLWHRRKIDPLISLLRADQPETQAIAAFALGELQGRDAEAALIEAFQSAAAAGDSLWAVTEALTLIRPALVTGLIRELVVAPASLHAGQRQRCLVYLIGRMHYHDPYVRAFLDKGLTGSSSTTLIARTLRALGDLRETSYSGQLEAIAGGDFSYLAAWSAQNSSDDDHLYLRRVAIEELGRIGGAEAINRLRKLRDQSQERWAITIADERRREEWLKRLDEAYHRASEQIALRTSQR